MPDQTLLTYIKQNLRNGFSETEIRQALLGAGWAVTDVEQAFAAAKSPAKPQSMDILEKELAPQEPNKPKFLGRMRRVLIPSVAVVVALPLIGLAGIRGWQWFFRQNTREQVNSATITSENQKIDAAIHDQLRLENIQSLQTALAAFFNTKHSYPKTVEEQAAEKIISLIPTDPKTDENYLYMPFGEPATDYSLSFVLETDFGTLKSGLHSVGPTNLINAGLIKTHEQMLQGRIQSSPSADLKLSSIPAAVDPGEEITLDITTARDVGQMILVSEHLRLVDFSSPFGFTFSSANEPGEREVRIFGFTNSGEILFQSAKYIVKGGGI